MAEFDIPPLFVEDDLPPPFIADEPTQPFINGKPEKIPLISNSFNDKMSVIKANLVTERNPDEAAKVKKLSDPFNIPYDAAKENQQRIEDHTRTNSINYNRLLRESPVLATAMLDKATAAIVQDDIGPLSLFEKFTVGIDQGYRRGTELSKLAAIGRDRMFNKELTADQQFFLDEVDYYARTDRDIDFGFGPVTDFILGIPESTAEMTPLFIDVLKEASKTTLLGTFIGAGVGAVGLGATTRGVGAIPGAIGGAKAGFLFTAPKSVLYEFAALEAGLAMNDFDKLKSLDGKPLEHSIKVGGSLVVGSLNAVLERMGLGAILKVVPHGDKIASRFTSKAIQKMAMNPKFAKIFQTIGSVAGAGIVEGATEGMQQTISIVTEQLLPLFSAEGFESYFTLSEEKNIKLDDGTFTSEQEQFLENALGEIAESIEKGAQGGIGLSAGLSVTRDAVRAVASSEAIGGRIKNSLHKSEQQTIQEMKDAAKSSKTYERSPETFKGIVNEQLGPEAKIYLRADKAEEYFQENPDEFEEFASQVPEFREQYEEALELGGDVILPAGDVIAAIATDQFIDLEPELRTTQASISDTELESIMDDIVAPNLEQLNELNKEGLTDGELVFANIEQQLLNSGSRVSSNPESAKQLALFWQHAFETLSERNPDVQGVIDNLFGNVTIQGVTPQDRLRATLDRVKLEQKAKSLKKLAKKSVKTKVGKTKKPLLDKIKKSGGIEPGSRAAQELEGKGIRRDNARGLFKKGGATDLDNIVVSELTGDFISVEETGFADPDAIIEALEDEIFGGDELTEDEQILSDLSQSGVDIDKLSDAELADLLTGEEELFQKGRIGPRGSVTFDNEKSLINIFQSENKSTMLHETGHAFLEIIRAVYTDPAASEQSKKDWQAVLDWFEVESGDDIGTEQHEQWARGVEKYLATNKAPSISLRRVFGAFRSWLVNVYLDITKLNVDVTPEIAEVMDRLLATDSEIEYAAETPVFSEDDAIFQSLTGAEREDYVRKRNASIDTAKDNLYRKSLAQARKRISKAFKEESKIVAKEAEEQINASNVYRAIGVMQNGKLPDGTELPEGFPTGPLNREVVKKLLGIDSISSLPSGITVKEGGIMSPSIVAEQFGYASGSEMLQSMIKIPTKKQAIKLSTQAEMDRRHGDMLNDGTIEREAIESMQNADRTDVLLFELDAISREQGGRAIAKVRMEEKVQEIIDATPLRNMKADKFYKDEVNAARESGKATAAGNIEDAKLWKQRQILNHMLFREARKFDDVRVKTIGNFLKLMKLPKKGKLRIQPDYHLKIIELIDRYDFGPKMRPETREKLLKAATTDLELRQDIDEHAILITPTRIANSTKNHIKDLTVGEFMELRHSILALEKAGVLERTIIVQGKKQDLDERAIEGAAIIRDNISTRGTRDEDKRKRETWGKKTLNAIVGLATKTQSLVERMDGNKKSGFLDAHIRRDIRAAEVQHALRTKQETDRLREISDKYYGEKTVKVPFGKGEYVVTGENLNGEKIFINENVGSLPRESILAVANNQGTVINKRRVMSSTVRNYSQGDVDMILSHMREKDWQYVVEIWRFLDSFWPEISELEKRRNGYPPEKVEGILVQTPWGVVQGGYYPLMYDQTLDTNVKQNEIPADFKIMRSRGYGSAQTQQGFLIERVQNVDLPVLLNLTPINRHVNQVITDLTMSEAVENSYKFLNHPFIKSAINDTLGPETVEQLDTWIKDVAVGQIIASNQIDGALRNLRTSVTVGTMAYKVSTTLVQLGGLTQTMAELGTAQTAKGFMEYKKNPVAAHREVREKSEFMQARSLGYNRDIADAMRVLERGRVLSDLQATYFIPIMKMQSVVDTITWLAAYDKAIKDKSEVDAIDEADLIVETSQSSAFMSTLSSIERGTLGKDTRLSEGVKGWTTFYSYFNTKFNIAYRKFHAVDRFGLNKETMHFATDMVILFAVEAVVTEMLLGRADFDDDDDDATLMSFKWYLKLTAMNALAVVPGLRQAAGELQGFTANTAQTKGLGDLGKGVGALVNLATGGDVNGYSLVRSMLTTANILSPIKFPVSQINQGIRGMEEDSKGKNPSVVDYLLYRDK